MKMKPLALLPPLAMLAMLAAPPAQLFASSHREAPITALDQKADITDWYAFISPEHPDHVVMILNVDPFLEPANGPQLLPVRPQRPLRDEDRQRSRRRGRCYISVSFHDANPPARSLHGIRGKPGRDSGHHGPEWPGIWKA